MRISTFFYIVGGVTLAGALTALAVKRMSMFKKLMITSAGAYCIGAVVDAIEKK